MVKTSKHETRQKKGKKKTVSDVSKSSLIHLLMAPKHSASQYKDDQKAFTSLYLKSSEPGLHRSLSLPDFTLAFIRYMNIMTEVCPERQAELISYLSFVVKISCPISATSIL